jgi:DNA modification methylase
MVVECAHDLMVDTATLVPNPRNPNHHPQKQIELLAKIIKHTGWRNPIVVSNRSGFIVKGHARLEAAKLLKEDKVPVDYQDYENEAMEWADCIADNRIAELAEPSLPELKDLLQELDTGAFDMDLTGFDSKALEELMTQTFQPTDGLTDDDAIPEPKETICKPGDLWLLGRHRLLCGDSTKVEDVARLMNGEKISLLVTDPPYGVSYADKNKFLNAIWPANRVEEAIVNDHETPDDMQKLWMAVFTTWREWVEDGASYYVTGPQGGDLLLLLLLLSLRESGYPLRHMLIWAKNQFVIGRSDYHYQHEPIIFGWAKGTHEFYGSRGESSLWEIPKPRNSDLHPTMKPVELFGRAITNSSAINATVGDPFLGSGTTLIACEKLNRRCYGMEIDAHYCDVIIKRFEDYAGQKAQRG